MNSEVGNRYGRWNVIGEPFWKDNRKVCLCRCSCEDKTERLVVLYTLRSGKSTSCGCVRKEMVKERSIKHGSSKSRLFGVWGGIKTRCYNKKISCYKHYGGRGIKVCDEWLHDFSAFQKWAIENGYDENAEYGKCTLDRIDVNGNYEPSNCRWITLEEQSKNKTSTVYVTHNGETKNLFEWSEETGLDYSLLRGRHTMKCNDEKMFRQKAEKIRILYNGESHTIKEWEQITGIRYETILSRYRENRPLNEVFYKGNLKLKHNQERKMSLKEGY